MRGGLFLNHLELGGVLPGTTNLGVERSDENELDLSVTVEIEICKEWRCSIIKPLIGMSADCSDFFKLFYVKLVARCMIHLLIDFFHIFITSIEAGIALR